MGEEQNHTPNEEDETKKLLREQQEALIQEHFEKLGATSRFTEAEKLIQEERTADDQGDLPNDDKDSSPE